MANRAEEGVASRGSAPTAPTGAAGTGALWAKIRGEVVATIPFATYNLHPFGPLAQDPSYEALLRVVAAKASMLVKHSLATTATDARQIETRTETSPAGVRRTLIWHTPKGPLQAVSVTPTGQPSYLVEHFIKSTTDMARVMSVPHPALAYDLAPTRRLLAELGNRGVLYIAYPDPMYSAASLFDIEDFVVRCVTEPNRVQALVDYCMEGAVAEVERLAVACHGLPLLFYTAGPEVATPPLLPPQTFRRLVTPYQRQLVGILHAEGHRAAIHCHGRVRQVLDDILEIGADVLEPIEPPDQGDIGLPELLDRTRGRVCLMGHIQDQEFYRGEAGLLRRRVEEIAAVLRPEDRYVMTPTCTPFQHPVSPGYARAYSEWLEAAAETLP